MQYSGRKSVEIGRAEVMVALLLQRIFSDDIMRSSYHMESQLSVLRKVSSSPGSSPGSSPFRPPATGRKKLDTGKNWTQITPAKTPKIAPARHSP